MLKRSGKEMPRKSTLNTVVEPLKMYNALLAVRSVDLAVFVVNHRAEDPHDFNLLLRVKSSIRCEMRSHVPAFSLDQFVQETAWAARHSEGEIFTTGESVSTVQLRTIAEWYASRLEESGQFRAWAHRDNSALGVYRVQARPIEEVDLSQALIRYGRRRLECCKRASRHIPNHWHL